jgi:hypothetical protein
MINKLINTINKLSALSKRAKIIILIVLSTIVVLSGIYLKINNENKKQEDEQSRQGETSLIFEEIPTGDEIEISDVEMKNFYNEAGELESETYVPITKNADYTISFLNKFNTFLISITSSPFEERRAEAETALLEHLNIGKKEACKLNVEITTPRFANPTHAGLVYGLSFCE